MFTVWILLMVVLGLIYIFFLNPPDKIPYENIDKVMIHEELISFLNYPVDDVRNNADLIIESIKTGNYKLLTDNIKYYFDGSGFIIIEVDSAQTIINFHGKILITLPINKIPDKATSIELQYLDKKVKVGIVK